MAHPTNNDGTHRETSSLHKATEGVDPTTINKRNVKLSELKNNPSQRPVKHSDFIVRSIDGIRSVGNKYNLKRGETATIEVMFTGAAEGFLEETRYTPQNFTWTTSQPDKLRIIESSSTSGVYKEGSNHRAYKITVKNVWNKCADSVGEHIDVNVLCVFKDQFNNNLDSSHGYGNTHTLTIKCAAINIFNQTTFISNGNSSSDTAWDNSIRETLATSAHGKGKNFSPDQNNGGGYWQGRLAKNGRQLTKIPDGTLDEQEVIIQDRMIEPVLGVGWTTTPVVLNSITSVSFKWQKLINGSWTDVITSSQVDTFFPNATGGGTLETYYQDNLWTNRVNIQNHLGTGTYRCIQTIVGDEVDPWTCVKTGSERLVTIYPKLPSWRGVYGSAYICKTGSSSQITINEPSHSMHDVTYSFYIKRSKLDTHTYIGSKRTSNGRATMDISAVHGDCYVTVRAGRNGVTGVRDDSGYVWSQPDVVVHDEYKSGVGSTTNTQWYDTSTAVRRILQVPAAPTLNVTSRTGANREIVTFQIQFADVTAPPFHVYEMVQWRITAVDVDGNYSEPYTWKNVSAGGSSTVVLTKTCPVGSQITIEARSVYSGLMGSTVVGVHQTNVQCGSVTASTTTKTLGCDQVCFIGPGGKPKKSGYDGDRLFQNPESRGVTPAEFCGGDKHVHPQHKVIVSKVERSITGGPWAKTSSGDAYIQFKQNDSSSQQATKVSTASLFLGSNQSVDPDKTWTLDIKQDFQISPEKTTNGWGYSPKLYIRRINN